MARAEGLENCKTLRFCNVYITLTDIKANIALTAENVKQG
jgi:hypothetical protein